VHSRHLVYVALTVLYDWYLALVYSGEGGEEHVHCAAPAVCLLWGEWGEDSYWELILESWWLWRAAIPLGYVIVKVRYCVRYRHPEPVVVVVSFVICD